MVTHASAGCTESASGAEAGALLGCLRKTHGQYWLSSWLGARRVGTALWNPTVFLKSNVKGEVLLRPDAVISMCQTYFLDSASSGR